MRVEHNFGFEEEAARQLALERYDVLDTGQEYSFDRITKAVQLALDVPSASISFMDGNRQWFKSRIGIETSEISRDTSFCTYTIGQNGSLIIQDATLDPRFKDSPLVSNSPFFRSYIGVPLTTPDGHGIGTLSAMDVVPRKFRFPKIELMEQLAELVIHELELRQRAEKDRLTGALTRSGFSLQVQQAISGYDRHKIPSTLALFDVDWNKTVTHPIDRPSGSLLLRTIIQSLINRLSSSDHVGRIGGTQFAVLFTGASHDEASLVTKGFLNTIEQMDAGLILDFSHSEISPGIGICEDWLKQANTDLRLAKRSRRREFFLNADKGSGQAD